MSTTKTFKGNVMAEVVEQMKSDINSFVWKGKKIEVDGKYVQEEKKLMDCTEEELNGYYSHCQSMLYNKSDKDPGRYPLLKIIRDQRLRCNTELLLRWLQDPEGVNFPRYRCMEALRGFLDVNRGVVDPNTFPIEDVLKSDSFPAEFCGIPCSIVLEGCMDRLGVFNKKHLTLSFILKQGLWFTPQESKELVVKDANGNIRDRIEIVRENLKLPNTIMIHTNPKGLSYSELRSMINLRNKKYFDLSTDQLLTLRDKILFALEDSVQVHINQWEERKEQIRKVMEAKGFALPTEE